MSMDENWTEWRTSTYSGATNECVEVRGRDAGVDVRDTRNRADGYLGFPAAEWAAFLHRVKTGAA